MARKIIVGERRDLQNYTEVQAVFWLIVPPARKPYYVNPAATSVVPGISAPELVALQDGSVVESVQWVGFNSNSTLAQIGAALITAYNAAQALLTSSNHLQFYGSTWDGSAWVVNGTG